MLIAIHVSSPDPIVTSFPSKCESRFGCSRVADEGKHSARGLEPPRLQTPINVTLSAVEDWINSQNGARVLFTSSTFIHARFLTFFWGFADDFFVNLRCVTPTKSTNLQGMDKNANIFKETLVEVQGQLRLGKSDLGVNARRNQRFIGWLNDVKGELLHGSCR